MSERPQAPRAAQAARILRRTLHVASILVFALAGVTALWQVFLVSISARPVATAIIKDAAVIFVDPLLSTRGGGGSGSPYDLLSAYAAAHPNDPVPLQGIRVRVLGKELADKKPAEAADLICDRMAASYYDNGEEGTFEPGSPWSQLLGTVGETLVAEGHTSAESPVERAMTRIVAATLPVMTAKGHAAATTSARWTVVNVVLLGLLLALRGRGWARLRDVAIGLLAAALPFLGMAAYFASLWSHDPATARQFAGIFALVVPRFWPLVGTSAVAGLVGLGVALIAAQTARWRTRRRAPAALPAALPEASPADADPSPQPPE